MISLVTSVLAISVPTGFPRNEASSLLILAGFTKPLGARDFALRVLFFVCLINLEEFLNMCKLHNYLNIKNEKLFLYFILKIYKSNDVLNQYYNIENNPIYNNNNKNLKMTICE